jgi:hypothetical protein
MVAMTLRRLVAASALLPAVSAGGLGAEQPIPGGPVQTPAPDLKEAAAVHAVPRAITERPHARGLLEKRDTNTCGYVNGNASECFLVPTVPAGALARPLTPTSQIRRTCALPPTRNVFTTRTPMPWAAA